jgi:tetratricopeptide (TPR) repeat protein
MASAAGRKVGVVGWWATHPAEEVNGFFLSDHASPILVEGLPLEGAAFPTSLQAGLAQVIARDGKIFDADLAPFLDVPVSEIAAARASSAGLENPIVALSRILAATRISQRAARDLYDKNLPDAMLLYFEGTDEIGHVFAPFTPPRLACVSDADFARYGRAVETYFEDVDRILGQWIRRAQEDGATLLVHSDHGFKWGEDRPCQFASGNVATAAFWHRLDGVLALWGARVAPAAERGRASLFDITPTVLALLDLPADRRMPGHPISALRDLAKPAAASGSDPIVVRRVPAEKMSAEQSSEYAKKLLALGYLSPAETQPLAPTGGDRPGLTEGAWNNLGVYERETRKNFAAARQDFEKSLSLRPDYYAAMFNLAVLYRSQGDTKKAEDWLLRSLAALKADPAPAVIGWAREYEQQGKTAAAKSLLEGALRSNPDNEAIVRESASLLYPSKDCRGAIAKLERFEKTTRDPKTLNALALFHTCLAHRDAVIRLLEHSLALAPNQPEVARTLETVRNAR